MPKAATVVDGRLNIDEKCLSCGVCTGKCPFKAVAHESETLYKIYLGGTWGKQTRIGTSLSRLVREDEVLEVLERALLWYKENGLPKERFGKTLDRIGFENAEKEILPQ